MTAVTTILIVTGAAAWAAFLCIALWALVVEGIQWHREGRARLESVEWDDAALDRLWAAVHEVDR